MFRSLGAGMITNKLLDCKTVVFFALVIRMRAVFERMVWSACEYGEWDWGERLARGYPRFRRFWRFAPLRASQRKKKLFCSLLSYEFCKPSNNWHPHIGLSALRVELWTICLQSIKLQTLSFHTFIDFFENFFFPFIKATFRFAKRVTLASIAYHRLHFQLFGKSGFHPPLQRNAGAPNGLKVNLRL